MSTLIGWVGGDSFKYGAMSFIHAALTSSQTLDYLQNRLLFRSRITSTVQNLCGLPTLSGRWYVSQSSFWRVSNKLGPAIVAQRLMYGNAPPPADLAEEDDLEQALALEED
jgi:hypothetical protein